MKKKLAFWCPIFFWFPRVIKKYIPPPYPSGPFNYWIYNPEYLCSGRKGQLLCEGIFQGQNDLCLSGNTSYLSIHLPIDQFNQFINDKLMKSIFKVKSIQLIKSINNATIYDTYPLNLTGLPQKDEISETRLIIHFYIHTTTVPSPLSILKLKMKFIF